jgi:hypothetical protein
MPTPKSYCIFKRFTFMLLIICLWSPALRAQLAAEYASGDAELDRIRQEVRGEATTRETFKLSP